METETETELKERVMSSNGVQLAVIIICLVMSAYFSATETAFSSLNRIRVKNMADKGNKRAALVMELEDNFDNMLSSMLIGNNIVNILGTSLATLMCVRILGEENGASVSTVIMTVVVLVFGEVTPKSVAKEMPEQFAMFSAPFMNLLTKLLTPLNFLFAQWKKLLAKLFQMESDHGITEEELLTFVEEAKEDGGIDEQEGRLIRNAVEFTERDVMDIGTPRVDVIGVPEDAELTEIDQVFAETMFSRLPVYRENIDCIVGIIYQKDFYSRVYHKGGKLADIIRPALFVSESKKIGSLLKELQQQKMHIAVIVDEFGGTAGIVTLEDILEELVGEIWDEHDEVIQEIEKISDREYIVRGDVNLDKFMDLIGRETESEAQTVSGWVMDLSGEIPEKGDVITKEDLKVTVLEMDRRRVERVKIEILPKKPDEED